MPPPNVRYALRVSGVRVPRLSSSERLENALQLEVTARAIRRNSSGTPLTVVDDTSVPSGPDPKLVTRFADTRIRAFRGNPTLGELAALSPSAFVAEVLIASYDSGGPGIPSFHRECLAVVFEDETLAHVVCRAGPPEMSENPWRVSISSLKRRLDGQWRVLPAWDLLAGGGMMRALFEPPTA